MTDADRLILRALHEYESGLCACGHPRSESWSPEHDPANPEHVARYQTGAPYRCFACTELAKSQKRYTTQLGQDSDYADGAYWVTELVPRGLALAPPG
ncbi:hypothetical protein [Phycicoccus avicenniae]|uniref:hypothetical protein n=1 Tax=Phycicoccus avicenniae TaxID=2828860 RepID=UPI003D2AA70B